MFKGLSRSYAPLNSFAGKVQIGYAYGIIDEADFNDLERIRWLRNEAAHSDFDFRFDNEGVANLVASLTAFSRIKKTPLHDMLESVDGQFKDGPESRRLFVRSVTAMFIF